MKGTGAWKRKREGRGKTVDQRMKRKVRGGREPDGGSPGGRGAPVLLLGVSSLGLPFVEGARGRENGVGGVNGLEDEPAFCVPQAI